LIFLGKILKEENMGKDVKFIVRLTPEERAQLLGMINTGKRAASVLMRARVLLKADADGPNWSDPEIVEAFDVSLSTIHRVRQAFVEESLQAALERKKATGRQYRKLDGVQEARLIAVACSQPPAGRARWTLQLLADKMVELKIVDSQSVWQRTGGRPRHQVRQIPPASWSSRASWQTLIYAANEATGRKITIRSPQRLRALGSCGRAQLVGGGVVARQLMLSGASTHRFYPRGAASWRACWPPWGHERPLVPCPHQARWLRQN
jgi:transposase